MCEPATLTTVATLAVTALSTGLGMYAQNAQQKAQTQAANNQLAYQQQQLEVDRNAKLEAAQRENAKTAADLDRQRRNAQRQMGEMRSGLAANGIEMDSGTPLSLLGENAQELQYDANITAQNGAMAAWQYQSGATTDQNEINFAKYQQSQLGSDKTSSLLGMGGTLLGGLASGLNQYNGYANSSRAGGSAASGLAGASASPIAYGTTSGTSATWSKQTPYAWINWSKL